MASHGIVRGEASQKSEKERAKEQQDIERYRSLVDQVHDAVETKDFTRTTLDLTSKLLKLNPEYYTIWNHRRRILLHLMSHDSPSTTQPIDGAPPTPTTQPDTTPAADATSQEAQNLLQKDLTFLIPLLISYPKCYWIWNHRSWLLSQASSRLPAATAKTLWEQELGLVSKMLTRDKRNFHGWSYRRTVVAALRELESQSEDGDAQGKEERVGSGEKGSITEQEFAYTTKMIGKDLSNFSAWHQRSKLIPRLLDERNADAEQRRKIFDEELARIEEPLSIDPFDQSMWYYHQYLVTELVRAQDAGESGQSCFGPFTDEERVEYLRARLKMFKELLVDIDDCKWVYQSLLEFAFMLRRLPHAQGIEGPSQEEVLSWLRRLQALDPLRKGRWDDLEKRLTG